MAPTTSNFHETNSQKVTLIDSLKKLSKGKKIFLTGYFFSGVFTYCTFIYTDGKSHLLKERKNAKIQNRILGIDQEWNIVKEGCARNTMRRLFQSIFFPYIVFQNIIPSLILKLNPEETKEQK
jgi:hypothetical protein